MGYVDGFLVVVPKKNVPAYRRMSRKAGRVWMKHGALQYVECMGDDLAPKSIFWTFPKLAKLKPSETVWFSFIVYKSKTHRNAVNKRVMADPYMEDPKIRDAAMPFDPKKMAYGGFRAMIQL